MNRYVRLSAIAVVSMLVLSSFAFAQGQPASQTSPTSIKLQIVLSRYEGDKKINSFPYSLLLAPGDRGNVRNGAEIAVPQAGGGPTPSYTLQQVGSQIDASVTPTADGKYKLNLSVTDRSIVTGAPAVQGGVANVPSFRNNTSTSNAILSNGETVQFTSSADRASNETFRIDVTLTVGNK